MKHNLILVYSRTKYELNNSEFAQVRKFRTNVQKIPNLKYLKASIDFDQIQDQRSCTQNKAPDTMKLIKFFFFPQRILV